MGRVEIEITDNRTFQDIALLIDRADFQKDLELLKKELRKFQQSTRLLENYLIPAFKLRLAIQLALKYKYPHGFGKAILAGAENNKITDKDVANCYVTTHLYSALFDEKQPYYPNKNEIVLSIYPYALKDKLDIVLKDLKTVLVFLRGKIKPIPKDHPLNQSAVIEIKKQRKLYWLYKSTKNKKGYGSLSRELGINHETLRSSIRSYKNLLALRVLD